MPGHHFKQHHAQRIDIGEGGDRLAAHLFRRGVVQGEGAYFGGRVGGIGGGVVEQRGDAEIQQLNRAVGADQDVGRLQVAVHHQVGVGMADHRADLQHQLQARFQRWFQASAVIADRLAFYVVQGQVGLAMLVHAGIQQLGQVRVLQPGEDLAFAAEALAQPGVGHAAAQQLQRHLALVQAITALGQPDLAHAALAQRAQQAVGAHLAPRAPGWRRGPQRLGHELLAVGLLQQQVFQVAAQGRVVLGQALQAQLPRLRGQLQQLVQPGRQ